MKIRWRKKPANKLVGELHKMAVSIETKDIPQIRYERVIFLRNFIANVLVVLPTCANLVLLPYLHSGIQAVIYLLQNGY